MTSDRVFKLHPEAARDITDIWEYIAKDNPLAAGRVRIVDLERADRRQRLVGLG